MMTRSHITTFVFALLMAASGPARAQDAYQLGPDPKPDVEGPEPSFQEPASSKPGPHRSGFTLNVSQGAGVASFFGRLVQEKSWWGLGGPNVGLGGFLTPRVALLFQINGLNFGPFHNSVSSGLVSVGGVAIQYWPNDMFYLMAGGGFALIHMVPHYDGFTKGGGSLTFQVGFLPLVLRHHALGLYVTVSTAFALGVDVVATHFGMVWQYY